MKMKTRIGRLCKLASVTASLASGRFSSAQKAASKTDATALAAGKSAQHAIGDAIDHKDTKAAVMKAIELATAATIKAKKFTMKFMDEPLSPGWMQFRRFRTQPLFRLAA